MCKGAEIFMVYCGGQDWEGLSQEMPNRCTRKPILSLRTGVSHIAVNVRPLPLPEGDRKGAPPTIYDESAWQAFEDEGQGRSWHQVRDLVSLMFTFLGMLIDEISSNQA
jgi:hypothetical protein